MGSALDEAKEALLRDIIVEGMMPSRCFSTKPMVWKERVNKLATVT